MVAVKFVVFLLGLSMSLAEDVDEAVLPLKALTVPFFVPKPMVPVIGLPMEPVTPGCLACMCETMSGCTPGCVEDTCGIFRLTWAFWADAGKPTVPGMEPEHPDAYRICSEDYHCASIAIQNYMRKFAQDCNGDGRINCHDYMAIHTQGGYACKNNIPLRFLGRFDQCVLDSTRRAIIV